MQLVCGARTVYNIMAQMNEFIHLCSLGGLDEDKNIDIGDINASCFRMWNERNRESGNRKIHECFRKRN